MIVRGSNEVTSEDGHTRKKLLLVTAPVGIQQPCLLIGYAYGNPTTGVCVRAPLLAGSSSLCLIQGCFCVCELVESMASCSRKPESES
jgi:hypothetical protein